MINKQSNKQREGHPVHTALVFGLSIMSTVLVIQLAVEIFLWMMALLLASSVLHAILCTGPIIYVYFLSDYKCTGHIIFVHFLSGYKYAVYYMGLVACMFVTFSQTVIQCVQN
jgi:hypothetical protein